MCPWGSNPGHIGYRRISDHRVLPRFGGRKVGTLTRADVRSWLAEMTAEGLAPATVQHHYVALRKAMKFAQHE
ncbi:MAG: site-specific integrase, partial [Naasia sp.]|uniref:site-specific integrase n=1 Tax=Naasia sp. TaxID=2546198 RepID=UPI0026168913